MWLKASGPHTDCPVPAGWSSARKHGVPDEDVIHADHHPIRVLLLDDLTMLLGPDRSA